MASLDTPNVEFVSPTSRALIGRLAEREWAADFYLAGSLALAAQIEHRPVQNIDLMGGVNRLTGAERRDLLADLLAVEPGVRVETARDGYLFTRAGERGPALKFFHYPYPLVEPLEDFEGMGLASLADLGLMKLGAIISRARRRDFVDLYFLSRHLPLADLLEHSADKYGHVRDFPVQAFKGLMDRPLIADEPMPETREDVSWQDIEDWLDGEVRSLATERFGVELG